MKHSKNIGWRAVLRRLLAVTLVVAMAGSMLLYRKSDVRIDLGSMENKGAQAAAEQLISEDSYASAPRLARMGSYLRSFLKGADNLEDCELAAEIALARAEFDKAIEYTEKAIGFCGEGQEHKLAELNLRMGYLYTLKEDYKSSLKWLNNGLAMEDSPDARMIRAQVRLNLGDPKGALDDVDAYLALTEDPSRMLPYMVNIYEAAEEYERGAECLTQLIDTTGDAKYLLDRAFCLTKLARMEEAAADGEAYEKAGLPQTERLNAMLALGWMREGNYGKAESGFLKAIGGDWQDPGSLYYYVVLCAYVNGDYARAAHYGDLAFDLYKSEGTALQADIGIEDATGELNVSLKPMDVSSLCMMAGASHMHGGEYERAIEYLDLCLEQSPETTFARYLRASCLLAMGRFEEAVPDFDASIDAGEEVERCRYGRAICRMQLGETEKAMEDFDWVLLNGSDKGLFEEASRMLQTMLSEEEAKEDSNNDPAEDHEEAQ